MRYCGGRQQSIVGNGMELSIPAAGERGRGRPAALKACRGKVIQGSKLVGFSGSVDIPMDKRVAKEGESGQARQEARN